ncbi:hypothetical protein C2G38_2255026, partial [Gigaspora rosea]
FFSDITLRRRHSLESSLFGIVVLVSTIFSIFISSVLLLVCRRLVVSSFIFFKFVLYWFG